MEGERRGCGGGDLSPERSPLPSPTFSLRDHLPKNRAELGEKGALGLYHRGDVGTGGGVPVSYTHLDVYKRQEYGLTGTLQFADVSVDESTGMVTLRAIFPNPKQELLPGMYVRAILNEGVDDQAILLPQRALLRDAKGNPTTYVVNAENKVEIRPLKVGRTQGNSWVVLDGLKAGDKMCIRDRS